MEEMEESTWATDIGPSTTGREGGGEIIWMDEMDEMDENTWATDIGPSTTGGGGREGLKQGWSKDGRGEREAPSLRSLHQQVQ